MKIYVRKIYSNEWQKLAGNCNSDFPWLFDSTSWSSGKKWDEKRILIRFNVKKIWDEKVKLTFDD